MSSHSNENFSGRRRSSSIHRASVSSSNINYVDENDHEMFSGAASEVVPSSISSFHHHSHYRMRSPRLSNGTEEIFMAEDDTGFESNELRPASSNASSVDLQERSNFKFFTIDQIQNAQGTSTMEGNNPNEPVDYDTNWNSYHDDYGNDFVRSGSTSRLRTPSISSSTFTNGKRHAGIEDYGSHDNSSLIRNRYSGADARSNSPLLDASNHEYFFPDFPAKLHYQRFYIAEEDLVFGIAGYQNCKWKIILYYSLCILSFGIAYLFFRWFPRYRIKCMGNKTALGKADWVVIETELGELSIINLTRQWYNKRLSNYLTISISQQEDDPVVPILISFEYRYRRIYYSPTEDIFKTNSNWAEESWCDLERVKDGLTQDSHDDRLLIFGLNLIDIKEKSVSQLAVDEVLHPFYIFQISSIILWLCDDYYYYAACIFLISVISIIQTLVETKKTLIRLRDLSRIKFDVRVWRNDFWKVVSSEDLVPGDIYEVSDPSLSIFPCDSVLLNGDCIVNESMLTGESVPVSKVSIDQDTALNLIEEFRSTKFSTTFAKSFLYSGTKIVRSRTTNEEPAMALVVKTGFNTTKGALIRSMLFPKPTGFKFYEDSFKYIGFMTLIAVVGFVFSTYNFIKMGLGYKIIILRALDIITIVVPPALPATLTIGTSFALARLRKKQVFCIAPTRVNVGGKLDVMCFDKTGTLTEDGLDILGIHLSAPLNNSNASSFHDLATISLKLNELGNSKETIRKAKNLLMSLVTCHSLKAVNEDLIGDPLDFKMFEFTNWRLFEDSNDMHLANFRKAFKIPETLTPSIMKPHDNQNLFDHNDDSNYIVQLREFDFVSQLRRMSVIVKPYNLESDDDLYVFTKGAPEVMKDICAPQTFPSNYNELLHYYTHNGYRVIAKSVKFVSELRREECESFLEFLGFIIFENKLKKETKKSLAELNQAQLRVIMCTGDNVLTAVSVGKESGLIEQDHYVFVPSFDTIELATGDALPGGTRLIWEEVDNPSILLDPNTLKPTSTSINSNYCLAVTGDVFKYLLMERNADESLINMMLMQTKIFARMSPDEKHELVEQLQKLDYTVGFCGDGANDCGALKAADVGISLSEAEASVAAPFTSRIFEISCVLDIIKEGRASLVTSFSCFQYISLYSAIQFVTVSILYKRGSNLGDFQFLYIDLFLTLPIAVFMSWSEPFPKLFVKRPTANLISPKILIPLVCNILLLMAFQIFIWLFAQSEPWYIKPVPGGDDAVDSTDNTVLFEFSNYQYIIAAVVLAVGPPYRKPVFTNLPFILNATVDILVSTALLLIPAKSWIGKLLQLTEISTDMKAMIVMMFILNAALMDIGYKKVFIMFAKVYKRQFGRKGSKKLFKNLKKEWEDITV
ncbi:hypothetical protein PACTADRAFT_184935 [Pachysolen tannophilus NRRL Y-2460]|uniref:Cation-transporting ATPase n=1 Tax=Pachysolen tannophilus NRRL Y-2460 TaxID=669874 RepID=A0A1E4U3B0_PACTA|nr:hypothetical protein PACTADRAFT_184935 [Pachysolen tannophilus NRRL Y-2460]